MLQSYLLTILAIPAMMIAWVAVQFAWRKTFREAVTDDDVLASRRGCSGCGCIGYCEKDSQEKSNTNSSIGGNNNGTLARL